MVGRILSGISTSLLFSSFESWMVCEHTNRGFDHSLITETFSYATFGNGCCAVLGMLY
jgi:MFS transporter, MFS domain-containing protein family, molybdate-anion transporter